MFAPKVRLLFLTSTAFVDTKAKPRDIDEVYALLSQKLTPELILLNRERPNRPELTLKGLETAIAARKK